MANSLTQHEVERWIVAEALPRLCGHEFSKKRLPLDWGGHFECDAVSTDLTTIACISTSCCKTASGKSAIGKFHKIKADALYLIHIGATRRLLVFTDPGMHDHFVCERARGRFPPEGMLELVRVDLPPELSARLARAAEVASSEVRPPASRRRRPIL